MSYPALSGWALNPMTCVLVRERQREIWDRRGEGTQRGEAHVKTEIEIGVMLPQAKEHWEPPKLEKARKDSSVEPSGWPY